VVWVALALLAAAACQKGNPKPAATTTVPTIRPVQINQGGDITVAAERDPACMDWISTCGASAWGVWTVETNTMPRAYDFSSDNLYKPSILLTGEADLRTAPAQVVTYHLNPKAVWSDGRPITSHDFNYTWDQIAHGQGVYDQSGYNDIASVDDSDPHVAVVTFAQNFAGWRGLFGGAYGVLPSHILEGQDRNAMMKDGYGWSGGPWQLAPGGWVKSQSIKLVPNPNYWGKKPDLNSVTFAILADPAAELHAFLTGQVLAAHPEAQLASGEYKSAPGALFDAVGGLDYEALWFNVEKAPLTSKSVRQAIAYSLDREAMVTQLSGSLQPGVQPIQSMLTPAYGKFYTEPFARYHPDLTMVAQLMGGDGWTKGTDGIWAKAGEQASIAIKYPADNQRRQLGAQIVQNQLKAAGFIATPTPEAPVPLFTQDLPAGGFVAGLYAQDHLIESPALPQGGQPTDNNPDLCRLYCATRIPTPTNSQAGMNYIRVADPNLNKYFADLDTNTDDGARIADANRGMDVLADLVPAIPIGAVPDIVVVNHAKLSVEGGVFQHNLAYGPYTYLNEWYLN